MLVWRFGIRVGMGGWGAQNEATLGGENTKETVKRRLEKAPGVEATGGSGERGPLVSLVIQPPLVLWCERKDTSRVCARV
jgi:hypothetical protein